MTISKREFSRDIYKWLKEGEYVVTNHGEAEYVVTVRKVSGVVTKESAVKDTTKDVVTSKDVVTIIKTVEEAKKAVKEPHNFVSSNHACGCKKTTFKTCPKHYCY